MMNTWLYALGAVFLTSLFSLIGVLSLVISARKLSQIILFLVSFAAGALLGDSFLHLLPEAIAEFGFEANISLGVLGGILIFFILEKFIFWRHCHILTSKEHPHPMVFMNLVGDILHNFIDGMVIAASFLASPALGLATTTAVVLHEIPQEIGDFGILIHGGFSRGRALLFNFLSGLVAILGALFVLGFGPKFSFNQFLIPFTAGGFIYIASSDLIPELKKEVGLKKSAFQLLGLLLGIFVMVLLKFWG